MLSFVQHSDLSLACILFSVCRIAHNAAIVKANAQKFPPNSNYPMVISNEFCDEKACDAVKCRVRESWNSSEYIWMNVDWSGWPSCQVEPTLELHDCQHLVFVHIPKAGGSSIASAIYQSSALTRLTLFPPHPWFHWPARFQKDQFGARYGSAMQLAVVRNPFTILVSRFFYDFEMCYPFRAGSIFWSMIPVANLETRADLCKPFSTMSTLEHTDPRFAKKSKSAFTEYVQASRIHLQLDQLQDSKNNVIVNHIIRLEDSEYEELTSSEGLLDFLCGRSTRNSTDVRRFHTVTSSHCTNAFFYFTAETCSLVSKQYSKDFHAFGYDILECDRKRQECCAC